MVGPSRIGVIKFVLSGSYPDHFVASLGKNWGGPLVPPQQSYGGIFLMKYSVLGAFAIGLNVQCKNSPNANILLQ